MNSDWWELKAAGAGYQDAHHLTTRLSNRLKALHARGLDEPLLDQQLESAIRARKDTERILRKLYKARAPEPIVKFQEATPGLGDLLMAQLIGIVGDFKIYTEAWWEENKPSDTKTDEKPEKRVLVLGEVKTAGVRDVWAYCGHGNPERKRRKGLSQEETFQAGNLLAKTITHEMADFALRLNGVPDKNGRERALCPYYWRYIERKAQTADRDGWTPLRRHNDAVRIVAKAILKDVWRVQHGFDPLYGKNAPWRPRRPLAA